MLHTQDALKKAAHQKATLTTTDSQQMTAQAEEAPELTPEQQRQAFNEYMQSPEVKANLLTWAQHLDERFHSNWFTIDKVIKKTRLKDLENANGVLTMLILGHLCHRVAGPGGIIKFKITLKPDDKITLLQKQVADLDSQKAAILREIALLEAKGAA